VSDQPTSFHDFKWACGHTGPGYCKICRDEQVKAKDAEIAETEETAYGYQAELYAAKADNEKLRAEKSEAIQAFADGVRDNEKLRAALQKLVDYYDSHGDDPGAMYDIAIAAVGDKLPGAGIPWEPDVDSASVGQQPIGDVTEDTE